MPKPEGPALLDKMTDGDLLDAWEKDRCDQAFETLVRRHMVTVLSVCQRHCSNFADANDAAQMTFVYLSQSAAKIRCPELLSGWLHRVAQRSSHAMNRHVSATTDQISHVVSRNETPLKQITRRHEAGVLDEELDALPEKYRTALVLHFMNHDRLEIVADRMNTSVGSVRGYLQRGKRMLAGRLRRRGVTPVLAFAATTSWSASKQCLAESIDVATSAAHASLRSELSQTAPYKSLQESFSTGSIMTPAMKVIAATTLAAGLILPILAEVDVTTSGQQTIELEVPPGEPASDIQTIVDSGGLTGASNDAPAIRASAQAISFVGGVTSPQQTSLVKPSDSPFVTVAEESNSSVAKRLTELLDSNISFKFVGDLYGFSDQLSNLLEVDVYIDDRQLGRYGYGEEQLRVVSKNRPHATLRSFLRQTLEPNSLQAVIDDNGVTIKAHPTSLASQGRFTDRWLDAKPEVADRFDEVLATRISIEFIETPLDQIAHEISTRVDFPVQIDRRTLDDFGLTTDMPFTFESATASLRSVLQLLLSQEDLTYTLNGESLVITTTDAVADRPRKRAYYLEDFVGSGPEFDFSPIMTMIQTTIQPETWSNAVGPSTMFPMIYSGPDRRPALIVCSTTDVHYQIKTMLQNLRGIEAKPEETKRPAAKPARRRQSRPAAQNDPFGGPSSSNPFEEPNEPTQAQSASDPFGTNPFGTDPFGTDPFGTDPFGTDPFGN